MTRNPNGPTMVGRTANGKRVAVLVDDEGSQVIAATIETGDIEIGAVELKDGATDTRVKVGAGTALAEGDSAVAVRDPKAVTDLDALAAVAGTTTGVAVDSDSNGTIQQFLRGLVKLVAARLPAALTSGGGVKVGVVDALPAGTNVLGHVVVDSSGLPTGAATSAQIGEVQASPTANTVLDRLKALLTGIVLAAGGNVIGKVGIDQTTPGTTDSVSLKTAGRASAVTLTRTNDTNGYTANDVVGAATGSTAALSFAIAPAAGGEIMITSVTIQINDTALISGETSYDLHLYNVTPPSALGDNAAFDVPSGDRASYLGKISLGTPVDLGSTLRLGTEAVNKQITAASGNVFGLLVTVGAYTPTASRVYVVTLHSVAL